ncbi:MAG: MiaB/RimO family radical SAM methylthiotransferase [Endomicrobium sp.]|jgi:threonylcarbamoyladenosine tRNA methylthiotransferase MtaB|nr:MiaB/RimO family radical SAM methylthiotransferase [Endomicrobium sp.]
MKTYFIRSFGCKVNQYETQLISDKFKENNMLQVLKPEEADIIVFNSCTVTAEADKECEYFLRRMVKLPDKKILLTGCFAINKTAHLKEKYPQVQIITKKDELFSNPQKQIIKSFDGRSRAFVKIQDGCNSFCSYCIVPYIRGKLWSKPLAAVLEEIENLIDNAYHEIVLTGIHIGKYDGGVSNLINEIIKIPAEFRIRISSMELNEIDDLLIELMKKNPNKICRHLHIPLQSGSDEILKKMNRSYCLEEFEKKISKIMLSLPDIALTSDIITGFPGETQEHHLQTCTFIERNYFARLHIFRYSDREGTKASKFGNKVFPEEIKKRSDDLFEIDRQKRLEFLNKNLGKTRKAVSIGKNKALTDNYISVKIDKKKDGIFEVIISQNDEI